MRSMQTGCLRTSDGGSGTNGYEVTVRLFSDAGADTGAVYLDFVAHYHHMRCVKHADDSRNEDLKDWRVHFASVVDYPISSWSAHVQTRHGDGLMIPTPCVIVRKMLRFRPRRHC